jgi:hypothetical protein
MPWRRWSHERRKEAGQGRRRQAPAKPAADEPGFLKGRRGDEKKYESVGLGWSYRYAGPEIVGSALAFNENVVHMAFFSIDGAESLQDPGNMVGSRMRGNFRV